MDWKNTPSLAALRAFESAARNESFSGAARELNVTHAAVAQHVRKLEADLAQALIARQGRGLAVTETGRQLAEQLRAGFETILGGVQDIRDLSAQRPLYIAVTPSFAANWLIPRMGAFWEAHPDISVSINPSSNLVDLRQEGFDLAIRFGEGPWPKLDCELLTHGDFWVVVAPALIKGRKISGLLDAGQLPWLMEKHMIEWRRIVDDAGLSLDDVKLKILETNELVLSATYAALGVSAHPKTLVERDVRSGAFVKICELPQGTLGYHLLTVPDRQTPALKVFKNWLRKTAREADMETKTP